MEPLQQVIAQVESEHERADGGTFAKKCNNGNAN